LGPSRQKFGSVAGGGLSEIRSYSSRSFFTSEIELQAQGAKKGHTNRLRYSDGSRCLIESSKEQPRLPGLPITGGRSEEAVRPKSITLWLATRVITQ